MFAAMDTGRYNYACGLLLGGKRWSPVQAMISIEMARYIYRNSAGIKMDDESIPMDVFQNVGIGGSFIGEDHTLMHFREAIWMPDLLQRKLIQDANVELLFTPLDALYWLGSPRPHVGATINFGGLESMAYASLTWRANIFDSPVFIEGAFGAAIHNGSTDGTAVAPARNLGCPVLFHEAASLGYDFTPSASVMLTIEHASHAGLCGANNRGLTNLGVRFGFKF